MDYTRDDLVEAKQQIDSTLHKLREVIKTLEGKEDPKRYRSQITLAQRRVRAFEIAVELIQGRLSPSGNAYRYCTLREVPGLKEQAAAWFHEKWGVPTEAYLKCMDAYLAGKTEYGWYLCLDQGQIIGGLGVIENDFHDRKDLSPNVCAVFTEEVYRGQGIAGRLLDMVVADMRAKDITPLYLVTDHIGFYERYGWEFLCMVQGDHEPAPSRMYIHR